jgi:PAS domain S-box-containing protein
MDDNNQFDTNPISIRGNISEDKKNTLPKVADFIRLVESFLDVYDSRVSLLNADGELVYTSNNSKEVIGYSFDDFEILETLGYIHPDDRQEVRKAFLETARGFSETKTYRIFRSSGELRWIQGVAIPHSPKEKLVGIFIIERDVTDDDELYLENKSTNFFQDIIQMINYPIIFVQNNLIVWSNDVLYDKYKFNKDEIINHPLEEIFVSQEEFANFLQKCNSELKTEGSMNFYGSLKGNNNIHYSGVYLTNSLAKNTLAKGFIIIFLITEFLITRIINPLNLSLLYQ